MALLPVPRALPFDCLRYSDNCIALPATIYSLDTIAAAVLRSIHSHVSRFDGPAEVRLQGSRCHPRTYRRIERQAIDFPTGMSEGLAYSIGDHVGSLDRCSG